MRIDELTQLADHRRFAEFLQQEWQQGLHDRTPVALLMLDVDFFDRFNETHGRKAGDECLRRVAAVLTSRVKRSSDLVARYGGEEFAIILAGAQEDGALGVAHWLREKIEALLIPHGGSSVCDYVTVSIGVAALVPIEGGSPERLIAAAAAALLRAKELGRNAVTAGAGAGGPFAAGV